MNYFETFSPLTCCQCGATIGNADDPYADPGCRACDRADMEAEYEAEQRYLAEACACDTCEAEGKGAFASQ